MEQKVIIFKPFEVDLNKRHVGKFYYFHGPNTSGRGNYT